jgi:mannose-6-phosphate isomerase-like protein (cupin superfamily)
MDTRGAFAKTPKVLRLHRIAAPDGCGLRRYRRPMDAFAIDRSDGREDGEDWTENYEELPGGANISIILESTTKVGVGPRLHKHPYAETFIIRRGWATFTVGSEQFRDHADRFWSCLLTRRISSPRGLMAMKVSTSTQESGSSPNGWSRQLRHVAFTSSWRKYCRPM